MSRILKRKEWDRNDLLQIALYHDFIQKNEDGWFNVDEIINYISGMYHLYECCCNPYKISSVD